MVYNTLRKKIRKKLLGYSQFSNWKLCSYFLKQISSVVCMGHCLLWLVYIYLISFETLHQNYSIFCSLHVSSSLSWSLLSGRIPELLLANQYLLLVNTILCIFFTASPFHALSYGCNSINIKAGLADDCIPVRPQYAIHLQQDVLHFTSAHMKKW